MCRGFLFGLYLFLFDDWLYILPYPDLSLFDLSKSNVWLLIHCNVYLLIDVWLFIICCKHLLFDNLKKIHDLTKGPEKTTTQSTLGNTPEVRHPLVTSVTSVMSPRRAKSRLAVEMPVQVTAKSLLFACFCANLTK